jgi:hypothetical protein
MYMYVWVGGGVCVLYVVWWTGVELACRHVPYTHIPAPTTNQPTNPPIGDLLLQPVLSLHPHTHQPNNTNTRIPTYPHPQPYNKHTQIPRRFTPSTFPTPSPCTPPAPRRTSSSSARSKVPSDVYYTYIYMYYYIILYYIIYTLPTNTLIPKKTKT